MMLTRFGQCNIGQQAFRTTKADLFYFFLKQDVCAVWPWV